MSVRLDETAKSGGENRTQEFDLGNRLALRPKEAAEALGISERTLREMLPELPVIRRGGVVLLPVEPLRGWLREQVEAEGRRVEAIASEVVAAIRQDRKGQSE